MTNGGQFLRSGGDGAGFAAHAKRLIQIGELAAYETGWVNGLLAPHGGSLIESVLRRVVDRWTALRAHSP